MRRIVIWLASTVTVVVLLFGYYTSTNSLAPESAASSRVPATGPGAEPSTTPSQKSSRSPTASPSGTTAATPPTDPSNSPSSASTSTYTGTTSQTRWGPVQVKITVESTAITQVTVLQSPRGNSRDVEINDYALPILIQDTIAAQSAHIDMVSGATVTSGGYLQSLQAALDQAGI